jgi:hypothetical protein
MVEHELGSEERETEPPPRPGTSSAGGVKPPGRIGSGLWDDSRDREKWRSAPIEDLGLSMRSYDRFRGSGLVTVDVILLRAEDEILALLERPQSGESFSRVLLTLKSSGSQHREPTSSDRNPTNRARQAYEELREKLDELGLMPRDADWDSSRSVN